MRWKVMAAGLAIVMGIALALFGQPSLEEKLAKMEPELNKTLQAREVQIDPGELLDLINNNNTALKIIDLQDEADYNLFHIIDSTRAEPENIRDAEWVKKLPKLTALVLVSEGEARATEAWKLLKAQGVKNLYILEGGIENWLKVYGGEEDAEFKAALGSMNPAADPDPHHAPKRDYVKKVKSIGPPTRKSGGCG